MRDCARLVFASKAALDAGLPAAPEGTNAYVTDVGREYVKKAGTWQKQYEWGSRTLSTNQDGRDVIIHDLGRQPTTVQIQIYNGGSSPVRHVDVQDMAYGAPNGFAVQCRRGDGSASPVGDAVTVFWFVA